MSDRNRPEDEARDTRLADVLRLGLDSPAEPGFVARVLAALDASPTPPTLWDLLAGWARRGIPVTVALVLVTVILATSHRTQPAGVEDVLMSGETEVAAAFLAGHQPPGSGVLFAEPAGR